MLWVILLLIGLGGVVNAVVEIMKYYKRKAARKRAIEEFENYQPIEKSDDIKTLANKELLDEDL